MRVFSSLAAVLVVAVIGGCREARLHNVVGDVEARPGRILFAKSWVGFPSEHPLTLHNRSPRDQEVRLSAPDGFAVTPEALVVAGGGTAAITVRFDPRRPGPTTATLVIMVDGARGEVTLEADAEVPPACDEPSSCLAATFDPATGACAYPPLADGSPCSSTNVCLESGQCIAGVCMGTAVTCDDQNPCTTDACDPDEGCLFLDASASCPSPPDPCQVAFCDPATGCGLTDAADGTTCGPADCVTAQVCLSGRCETVSVPEGSTCAEASPCQGRGVCQNQVCVRPPASTLAPVWRHASAAGRALDSVGTADAQGNLYFVECPSVTGTNGPGYPPGCEVISTTLQGFSRWRHPVATLASQPRSQTLVSQLIDGATVVTLFDPPHLEARRLSDGVLLWQRNLTVEIGSHFPTSSSETTTPVFTAGAAAADGRGRLFVPMEHWLQTDSNQRLHKGARVAALDAMTGAVQWSTALTGGTPEVVVDESGGLFVVTTLFVRAVRPFELTSLLGSSGAVRWSVNAEEGRWLGVASGVVNASGTAAYRTSDGSVLWGDTTSPIGSPVISGNAVWSPQASATGFGLALARKGATVGNRVWTTPLPGGSWASDLMLTQSSSALMIVEDATGLLPTWSLREVSPDGRETFACPLPTDRSMYESAALVNGRFVTLARSGPGGAGTTEIVAFDVGNRVLGATGWVTHRGGPERAGRPR